MKLTAIAPWMGSKRTMAAEIARQLGPHKYYFEGCCGSMAVLFGKAPVSNETVCDLHGALTNLAWVLQAEPTAERLFADLSRTIPGDDIFERSKAWLESFDGPAPESPNILWAYHYFLASWMGRNGVSGTRMTNQNIAVRWTANGGSGPVRFRAAVESIPDWCARLRNVLILRRNLFDVLPKLVDVPTTAIYIDPPYLHNTMSGTNRYHHDFKQEEHSQLAMELARFKQARVVVSYYYAEQLRDLYPNWTILDCSRHKHLHVQAERGSTRNEAPEVLVINGPAVPSEGAAS